MILVCPNCASRYLLSSSALGEEGRDVRCAKCHHEWYAEPVLEKPAVVEPTLDDMDEDEVQERMEALREDLESDDDSEPVDTVSDNDSDDEEIPNSVKPVPDDFKPPAHPEDVLRPQIPLQAKMAGMGAALFVFMIFVIGGFVLKNSIVTAWPPAAAIYELAGVPVSLKGEGLIVETLSASILKNDDGKEHLIVKGRVINLTQNAVEVPKMRAQIRSTNGEDGDVWVIDPPVDEVKPGASFAFTSDYQNAPRGAGSVNLTFIPVLEGMEEVAKAQ